MCNISILNSIVVNKRIVTFVLLLFVLFLLLSSSALIIYHAHDELSHSNMYDICEVCFNIPCLLKQTYVINEVIYPELIILLLTVITSLYLLSFFCYDLLVVLKVRLDN